MFGPIPQGTWHRRGTRVLAYSFLLLVVSIRLGLFNAGTYFWGFGGFGARDAEGVFEGVLLRGGERLAPAHADRSRRGPARVPPASAERGRARVGPQGALAMAVAHPPRLPCRGAGARPPHPPPAAQPLPRPRRALPRSLLLGQLLGHQV
jgi:hypothetical protein